MGNIMIVGVGGQGSLLASKLIGSAVIDEGLDVKVSEVHGMAQRGGSVVTYVKYGEKVNSPTIDKGQADFILSFELLEAARWVPYLKKGGKLIVNTQTIDPMPVIIGAAEYPKELAQKIKDKEIDIILVDALTLANKAGNHKAVNVVMMGILSHYLSFSLSSWKAALVKLIPERFLEMNKIAFESGRMEGDR